MAEKGISNHIDMVREHISSLKMRPATSSRGFTLIEVCIALGIVTFAVLPLLGLVAGGLGQLRSNMDLNQATNISQRLLFEAQQMDFATLRAKGTYTEYFTEEGDSVNAGDARIVYTATVAVVNPTTKSAPLQGATTTTPSTLVALSVKIRKTPHGVDNASTPCLAKYVNMISCDDLSTLSATP